MIDLGCLQGLPPAKADQLLSDGVFSVLGGGLLVAMLLAAGLSVWLRRRYRQQVVRLMGMDQLASAPARPAAADAVVRRSGPPATDSGHLGTLASAREHRITRATAVAWLVFVGLGLWVAGVDPEAGLSSRLGFATAAGLLALGPALTNLPPRWSRGALALGAAACVAGLLVVGLMPEHGPATAAADDDLSNGETVALVLLCGAAYLAMFHRSLRGQVLPLFVLLAMGLLVVMLPYGLVEPHAGACLDLAGQAAEGSPLKSASTLLLSLVITASLWLAFRLLGGLVRLIDRGWVSELSLPSLVSLCVFAMVMVLGQLPEDPDRYSAWATWVPLPWVAATLAAYALALGRPPAGDHGPQLLVLRVFSEDSRRHGLLDAVQARWRYVGAVHQIGGPDMVAMNVDPYESMMFLANRLHELFLPVAASPAQLQASLVQQPDREGRYRINEVFCFNTAWRHTVVQLMQLSDAIALDLRGLTAQREGTSFEIGQLARHGLLGRVVALGDAATDWAHVDRLLQAEGCAPGQLQRIGQDQADPQEALFGLLLQVAAAPAGQRSTRAAA
ncbi:MAG: hypothetical protein V4795_16360 [Pseudomonadota bacterium]